MITIKKLSWSNAFSYGKDNSIDFVAAPLTQLVGRNGHGKSSIALILEEVLFNKNSKSIKKADILNRYVKDKNYSIEVEFERDGTEYRIQTNRGTSQTVRLFKDGQDVSSHTATATYKMIEEILGFDHKTFAQIVYQSNASSLEFLTAADTARKKFLIEILNLTKYTKAQEIFKEAAQDLTKDISAAQAKVTTVSSWLDRYKDADLSPMELIPSVEIDQSKLSQIVSLESSIKSIDTTNKKISQNNTYKQLQSGLKLLPVPEKPTDDLSEDKARSVLLNNETVELQKTVKDSKAFVQKIAKLQGTCPTCLQHIDTDKIAELVQEQDAVQVTALDKLATIVKEIDAITVRVNEYVSKKAAWEKASKSQEEWEKYHQLIDTALPAELLIKDELQAQLDELTSAIAEAKKKAAEVEKRNNAASAHNAKVDTIAKQMVEMNEELETYSENLHKLSERMSILNVLTKTFSTTGLVAYKIECLVKDLEEITNKYLVDLSDGRFQISFKVSASDKLNVIITDNGRDIEMLALSGGEKARVNVATLLGIRKLMQTLSRSRINLLILDETVEALDLDGKERLVEVLLREEHLNTFLVSHGFTHPLLEKVSVVKNNNISKIEV